MDQHLNLCTISLTPKLFYFGVYLKCCLGVQNCFFWLFFSLNRSHWAGLGPQGAELFRFLVLRTTRAAPGDVWRVMKYLWWN